MEENYCFYCMKARKTGENPCPNCGASGEPTALPHQLCPGTVLRDKYQVGCVLGEGGFGITYLGRDMTLDLRVAIKEYYPNGFSNRNHAVSDEVTLTQPKNSEFFANGMDRFLREARILAKFYEEPGIVGVRDFFEQNGTAYIVMDYLDGITLKDYLRQQGPIPADVLFPMMFPVMEALEKIHAQDMIHRDISPDNLMLLRNGSLKLLDFGAAREVGGEKSLSVVLKPGFAPEEQYRSKGKQGPWTDVYALSATMYYCLTGKAPDESIQRLFSDDVQKPSELGVQIQPQQEDAILSGMAVRCEDRIQTIGELRTALNAREPDREGMRTIVVSRIHDQKTTDGKTVFDDGGQKTVFDDQTSGEAQDEKPKQKKPVKEKPVKEKPVREKPVKEKPAKEKPVKEKPVKEKPAESEENAAPRKKKKWWLIPVAAILVIVLVIAGSSLIGKLSSVEIAGKTYEKDTTYLCLIEKTLTEADFNAMTKLKELYHIELDRCDLQFKGRLLGNCTGLTDLEITNCAGVYDMGFVSQLNNLELLNLSGTDLMGMALADAGLTAETADSAMIAELTGTFLMPIVDNTGIKSLYLAGCGLLDASELSRSSSLNNLYLQDNHLTKLDLSACNSLNILNVSNNPLETLTMPEWAANLTEIHADNTLLSDLSFTTAAGDLQELYCSGTGISDLSPLSTQVNLEGVYLNDNQITDLSPLADLTELSVLSVNNNQITDLSPLSERIDLWQLYAGGNPLESLDGIANCTRIEFLQLNDCGLTDISVLENGMPYIKRLYLSNNQLTDVSVLRGASELKFLDLENNQITDMSWTEEASLTNLEAMTLANNQVVSLNLSESYNMEYLDASNNALEFFDIGFAPEYLDLTNNRLTELELGYGENNYVTLLLSNNPIEHLLSTADFHTWVMVDGNEKLFSGDADTVLNITEGAAVVFSYDPAWGELTSLETWHENYSTFYAIGVPMECRNDLEDRLGAITFLDTNEEAYAEAKSVYHLELDYPSE